MLRLKCQGGKDNEGRGGKVVPTTRRHYGKSKHTSLDNAFQATTLNSYERVLKCELFRALIHKVLKQVLNDIVVMIIPLAFLFFYSPSHLLSLLNHPPTEIPPLINWKRYGRNSKRCWVRHYVNLEVSFTGWEKWQSEREDEKKFRKIRQYSALLMNVGCWLVHDVFKYFSVVKFTPSLAYQWLRLNFKEYFMRDSTIFVMWIRS